jgi:hypothetical protein
VLINYLLCNGLEASFRNHGIGTSLCSMGVSEKEAQ